MPVAHRIILVRFKDDLPPLPLGSRHGHWYSTGAGGLAEKFGWPVLGTSARCRTGSSVAILAQADSSPSVALVLGFHPLPYSFYHGS